MGGWDAVGRRWITLGGRQGKLPMVEELSSMSGKADIGQEKARKIIEIWRKSETFPSDTTERLTQKITSTQPTASGSRSTTPPYEPGQPPPMSPALPPLDPPGPVSSTGQGRIIGEGEYPFPFSRVVVVSCLAMFRSSLLPPSFRLPSSQIKKLSSTQQTQTEHGNTTQDACGLLTPDIYPSSSSQMPCSHIPTKHASLPLQPHAT